jgi:hypothetical protein
MRHDDEHLWIMHLSNVSRAELGLPPGLTRQQAFVLKAIGDVAMKLWDRRLPLYDVIERLARINIARQQVEKALGPLRDCGYVYADDAPGNSDVILHLMPEGLDQYCTRLVPDYRRISKEILTVACQDEGIDVVELAHRSGRDELLVEHVLEDARARGDLRLDRVGQYIVVKWISPQLRRWLSGAA